MLKSNLLRKKQCSKNWQMSLKSLCKSCRPLKINTIKQRLKCRCSKTTWPNCNRWSIGVTSLFQVWQARRPVGRHKSLNWMSSTRNSLVIVFLLVHLWVTAVHSHPSIEMNSFPVGSIWCRLTTYPTRIVSTLQISQQTRPFNVNGKWPVCQLTSSPQRMVALWPKVFVGLSTLILRLKPWNGSKTLTRTEVLLLLTQRIRNTSIR